MADETYKVPENPVYNDEIRKLQDDDPVRASTVVNPVIEQLIENTAAVKQQADQLEAETGSVEESKGQPGGLATLDQDGKIHADQLPPMDYDAAGAADKVQGNLNSHKADAGLHVTAEKQSKWDAGAQAAEEAKNIAEEALPLSGGTMTGRLIAKNLDGGVDWMTDSVRNIYARKVDLISGVTSLPSGLVYFYYE